MCKDKEKISNCYAVRMIPPGFICSEVVSTSAFCVQGNSWVGGKEYRLTFFPIVKHSALVALNVSVHSRGGTCLKRT